MTNPKIVCLDGASIYPVNDSHWEAFKRAGNFIIYERTAPDEITARCADAEIVLTNKVPFNKATIQSLPKLRYIGVLATGFNIIDIQAAKDAGITVTNIPAYSTESVAQHTIALLFAITNRVEDYSAAVAGGKWCKCPDFTFRHREWRELAGKRFGIVGFGNIGKAVAGIAKALGMSVALYTSKEQNELPDGFEKMELDELFQKCDVVSLHCPLNEHTRHIADARRLALMKNDAILLNTARGPLVDEDALAAALKNSRIYAAGLDVLSNEPPKADCPLIGVSNCFITPHIAWASTEARDRLFDIALDNVQCFINGNSKNVIN